MRLEEALSYMENCIKPLLKHDGIFVLVIDGRCAAGKTTFAKHLAKRLSAAVIATDDFFLPQSQGENKLLDCPFDKERFMKEVLIPLKEQTNLCYHRFDCHTQSFVETRHIELQNGGMVIIEGAYVLHPSLHADWDFRLFMDIDKQLQKERIFLRNGQSNALPFFEKWIPLEEEYIKRYDIMKHCDSCFCLHEELV